MTSAEIGPSPTEVEAADTDEVNRPGVVWRPGERRRWGSPIGTGQGPGTSGAPSSAPAAPNPVTPTVSAPPGVVPTASTVASPSGVTAPTAAAGPPTAGGVVPPAGGSGGLPRVQSPGPGGGEPESLVDPDLMADMAPMALTAGMGLLPILGSALAGLLGGGGGNGGAAGTAPSPGQSEAGQPSPGQSEAGQPSPGQPEPGQSVSAADRPVSGAGLAPDEQQALEALKLLSDVYGDGPTTDPQVQKLREELGMPPGSGKTATAVKAQRLFQANAAGAFNSIDNQLAAYVTGLARTNKVDKKAVDSLIREVNAEVNAALVELGSQAYTKQGHQKVRKILSNALRKAHQIVAGSQGKSSDTASAINRLSNQYLYNISGKQAPADGTITAAAGGSAKARRLVETALEQIGKPYLWAAEGPNAFDCSGLVQYSAKAAGVNVPRVAASQYQKLPKVNPGNIRPGDLIFPGNSRSPGHVMIYIGNGQCVHAPGRGKVVTTKKLPPTFQAARVA